MFRYTSVCDHPRLSGVDCSCEYKGYSLNHYISMVLLLKIKLILQTICMRAETYQIHFGPMMSIRAAKEKSATSL